MEEGPSGTALDRQPGPENLFACSFSNHLSPIGSCNFSRIPEDVLRVDYMFCSIEERRAYASANLEICIFDKEAERQKKLRAFRQKLQREWSRTFFSQKNLSNGRLAGFFCKYPGLRKFIGTKLLLFSNVSDEKVHE